MNSADDLQMKLFADRIIQLIEEEFAPSGCELAPKWKGGKITVHPGNESQEKDIPLDLFYKKILNVRDCLRLIEQKISASQLDPEDKASIQSYVSRAYGTLTSFNFFFRNDSEKFVGQGRTKSNSQQKSHSKQTSSPLNEY